MKIYQDKKKRTGSGDQGSPCWKSGRYSSFHQQWIGQCGEDSRCKSTAAGKFDQSAI